MRALLFRRFRLRGLLLALALGLTLTACAGGSRITAAPGQADTGWASYYAGKFIGRPTANGEIYDPEGMTAAHRTLPFNTMLRVTRLSSGDSVLVRINDRGPFVRGRIIDLSRGAARRLGMITDGIARVEIRVLGDSTAVDAPADSAHAPDGSLDRRVSW